ncbi:MAG: TolC family protein [Gammaproteobacteria bacterium]|nr:TolC family protein [Gammaproteobacteria bacterium]
MIKKLLLLLLGLSLPALADSAPLSFEESVRIAAAGNADLQAAQARLTAAGYQTRTARSGYLPQLSASASRSESSGSAVNSTDPEYSVGLSARQNLFAGFQDQAKVQQATADFDSATAQLAQAKAQLSHDLKLAFAGLRYAEENVTLTAAIVRRLEENVRLVQLRFESGRENKGSYLLTSASLEQARFENLQARQGLVSAQAQLARVLGEPSTTLANAVGDVPLQEPGTAPDFVTLATATPSYRQADAQQQAADAGLRLARAPFYPSVDLTGTAARDGADWLPDDNRRTLTLSLSIPIFSGGKDYYGVQSAASNRDVAKANRTSVEQQTHVSLQQSYAAYVEAAARVRVDQAFLNAAETRAGIARARYQNGLVAFEDWDQIESDLIQRQKAFLATRRDRVTAEARWELAQGTGVIP